MGSSWDGHPLRCNPGLEVRKWKIHSKGPTSFFHLTGRKAGCVHEVPSLEKEASHLGPIDPTLFSVLQEVGWGGGDQEILVLVQERKKVEPNQQTYKALAENLEYDFGRTPGGVHPG